MIQVKSPGSVEAGRMRECAGVSESATIAALRHRASTDAKWSRPSVPQFRRKDSYRCISEACGDWFDGLVRVVLRFSYRGWLETVVRYLSGRIPVKKQKAMHHTLISA
jgi:hypothetical protein